MTYQLFAVKKFNSFGVVIDRLSEQSNIKETEIIDLMDMYTVLLLADLHIDFSRGRSGGLIFPSQNFPQFIVIHTVKGFGIVNKAEIDVFSGTLLLFR